LVIPSIHIGYHEETSIVFQALKEKKKVYYSKELTLSKGNTTKISEKLAGNNKLLKIIKELVFLKFKHLKSSRSEKNPEKNEGIKVDNKNSM
jgi:hypothetical protein